MSPTLQLEIAAICIIHIIAIVLSVVCLAVFTMKSRRDDPSANAFLILQGAMTLWMVFKILKTVSPDVTLRWVFILGYYACTCVVEAAFIEFGHAYARGTRLPRKIRPLVYGLPVLQFSWILTNPLHFLFYGHYDFYGDSFGPLFYAHMLIEYTYFGVGLFYCRLRFKKEFSTRNRAVTWIVSTAILVPLFLNLLYITKVLHTLTFMARIPVIFDITPIVFTWSTLLFMYATFNHDLFSLTPLMRHEITHHLNLPIALFNRRFRLGYTNGAFQSLFASGRAMDDFLATLPDQLEKSGESGFETRIGDASFVVSCRKIRTVTGGQLLVTLRNVTQYKAIQADIMAGQEKIEEKNKRVNETIRQLKELSKGSARKFVARELHDIIGHSLVAAIKLLEVARIYGPHDTTRGLPSLTHAVNALDTGLSGIKAVPESREESGRVTGEELKKEIDELIEQARHTGLDASLNLQGMIYLLEPALYTTLHRTCTEIITNCLKHADATRLFLSVKIRETHAHLMAVDNGKGAHPLIPGSGLLGMEERARALGGEAHFSSEDGFMTRITIPRQGDLSVS
ncbi:histidine kinase N-terminal 7TM domain-containing protein [Desulfoluna spongiiphila]|uniref:histidine kinase N-terminal 7TM domain-containing protein n=1 Tax=Desulfoluna spongiiphila TaxID=419481 RepID=UPI00125B4CB6|nr:histidine kinase N-terminal 7TM domain-containing protein [Desulfoluna spongiiphila]VVS95126.1 histidine kinase n-terminal 7tm region [Desulfoluna spongiiphila]